MPSASTIERLTDYVLYDAPSIMQERNVEQTLHTSLASVVNHEYSFEGSTATLTEAALDIIGQLGALGLNSKSRVLALGTATSGIPYAPALKHVIDDSMVGVPKIETGYLLAKRNVTHPDDNLREKQDSEIEEYVAEKGYEAIQQEEVERLRKAYAEGDQLPDAIVLLDEADWTSKTIKVGRQMLTTAFGDNTPILTLSRRADLPWQYDGKARLAVKQGTEGKMLVVSDIDPRTRDAFRVIVDESIRYIQEAVRGQHPKLIEAYPSIDFDLTGDKKRAALLAENAGVKRGIQQQIAELTTKGKALQPMRQVLQEHLNKQDEVFAEELAMYGLAKGSSLRW